MSQAPLTVVLADDHADSRASFRRELERDGLTVVAECADGGAAVDAALATRPDVCLLDVQMPLMGGLEASALIANALPATSVLLISSTAGSAEVAQAVRAGAVGLLLKDIRPGRLAATVRAVADGECAFSRRAVRELLDQLRGARFAA